MRTSCTQDHVASRHSI